MNVKIDSRKVVSGDIFVAIRTLNHDGHNYVEDAIMRGATKVVVEEGEYSVDTLVVDDTRVYLAQYLKEHYYGQIKDLKLIGMTGTNGKTTTCYLIWQALNKLGIKTAYIGTIGFYMDDFVMGVQNTTPEILELYEMFLMCADNGCEYVVMEVSSHALDMGRVDGLLFDYVLFSNLTEEHLDYHSNFRNYALAKQKLFYQLKSNGKAIVNVDDPSSYYYILDENDTVTYGFSHSDYQIILDSMNFQNSIFSILCDNTITEYSSKLIGKYNLYNLTCVIILLQIIVGDVDLSSIISHIKAPKGRMDTIVYQDNQIIIDYAHTPDAVSSILSTILELKPNHVYTVIGCGGERDKYKRPMMADIACTFSDMVIFTSDNPRSEDPYKIIDDMIQSLDKNNYKIEINREKAIIMGVQMLEKNDILLVLGKGHETYQVIDGVKYPFDDKLVVETFISNI